MDASWSLGFWLESTLPSVQAPASGNARVASGVASLLLNPLEGVFMTRFLKHFLLWTFIVPWGASSLWLWLDGLRQSAKPDLAVGVGLLPVALLVGLYGVFFCSPFTLPVALLSYGTLSQFPRLAQSGLSQVGFVAITSWIGLGWSAYTAKTLNTGRTEYALLTVGLIAGAVLGMATVWLWSNSTVSSSKHGLKRSSKKRFLDDFSGIRRVNGVE
jgi:hypothetical protein